MNGLTDPAQLPLRDIILPGSVSWWPPAPGWWIATILILSLSTGAIIWYRRRRRYLSSVAHRSTLELAGLRQAHQVDSDDQQLLRSLSALLRRAAISIYPRADTASLSGEQWLAFLDRAMPDRPFSSGPGRILASGPYQPNIQLDAEALFALTETWIAGIKENRKTDHAPL